MKTLLSTLLAGSLFCLGSTPVRGDQWVHLLGVPDYDWYAGCFGTANGNLMGYWDRHGFPDLYSGPTGGGLAPLDSFNQNRGIRSMWASKAGMDGRPANQPGHIDDYWAWYRNDFDRSYEDTANDPYVLLQRPEHEPDCIGDFIGLSQKKWTNQNNECSGNIDAYSFVFWETNGARRTNYVPAPQGTNDVRDIQSGLRQWTQWRGYDGDVFTQLTDFNSTVPVGRGFTFNDLKAEIDAGYPVLLFLQRFNQPFRNLGGLPKANPDIHGMLAYGYIIGDDGSKMVNYKTSWASGPEVLSAWNSAPWQANLPVRGVIGFRPKPKITRIVRDGGEVTIAWDGPSSQLYDVGADTTADVHHYQLERATSLNPPNFQPVGPQTADRVIAISETSDSVVFFRVRLLGQ